jgi:hypothetical protein
MLTDPDCKNADTGATSTASGVDPRMATVEAVNRPEDPRGQSQGRTQRRPGRGAGRGTGRTAGVQEAGRRVAEGTPGTDATADAVTGWCNSQQLKRT